MKVKIPGYGTAVGNPKTILTLMKDAHMFETFDTIEEYIESVRKTAQRAFDISLQVTGSSEEERAESLLRAMQRENMIELEEEAIA